MITLSKALASCGGYIAGESALVEPHLKLAAPGFPAQRGYGTPGRGGRAASTPVVAGRPDRVETLHAKCAVHDVGTEAEINTGYSKGSQSFPALTGSSIRAGRLPGGAVSARYHVQPIVYPAVEGKGCAAAFLHQCAAYRADSSHCCSAGRGTGTPVTTAPGARRIPWSPPGAPWLQFSPRAFGQVAFSLFAIAAAARGRNRRHRRCSWHCRLNVMPSRAA